MSALTHDESWAELAWDRLPDSARSLLSGKLTGLYGTGEDGCAYDALAPDKRQSLMIFLRSFHELGLWDRVTRVENIYGTGGVGIGFRAEANLRAGLARRTDFTARWARHRDTSGGFMQLDVKRAALHLLYTDGHRERRWTAHFDLYNPRFSILNAWRHLLYEKIRGETPSWQVIRSAWSEDLSSQRESRATATAPRREQGRPGAVPVNDAGRISRAPAQPTTFI